MPELERLVHWLPPRQFQDRHRRKPDKSDPGIAGGLSDPSESESAGEERSPHMDVEAKPAFASRNIEIEAAIAEVQIPRLAEGIVDSAEHLPIDMRADPKTADIAIAGET